MPLELYNVRKLTPYGSVGIPMFSVNVPAGAPISIECDAEERVDLNKLLIAHPKTTYIIAVTGDSMETDIKHGDQILVDRSLEPVSGRIAVIEVDGNFTVKRLSQIGQRLWLVPSNKDYEPIEVRPHQDCTFWGLVTYVIHRA